MTLVDAGFAFNLPFPPLLLTEREVDLIIVLDASEEVCLGEKSRALERAQEYAHHRGIAFSLTNHKNFDSTSTSVVSLLKNEQGPSILYLPVADRNAFGIQDFSLASCTAQGDCQTVNFKYGASTIDKLVDIVRLKLYGAFNTLREGIAYAIKRRTGHEVAAVQTLPALPDDLWNQLNDADRKLFEKRADTLPA